MSSNARLALIALIIAGVLVGGFFILTPHVREVHSVTPQSAAASAPPAVTLKDSYKKGLHTLSGSVVAPDACTQVSALASLATSTAVEEIVLDLTLPATQGLCLEIPTPVSFSTTIAGTSGLPIEVRVNGTVATST